MESLETMKIHLDGIGHILADNNLSVPRYQRSYAWENKHVTDLLNDIGTAIRNKESEYFLGSIVITGSAKTRPEVVDGQQRLATITILIAAIRDYFYNLGDTNRADDVSRSYLMSRDLRSQEMLPRFQLNEVDHDFFSKRILTYPNDPIRSSLSLLKESQMKESHKLLDRASIEISDYVKALAKTTNDPVDLLLEWIDYIHSKARVIYVAVPDSANAFTIFETLNDRGLELAISDLLKNYLFSLADNRIEEVQRRWVEMIGTLEGETEVVTYIRHLWSSKEGSTREKDLYLKIKKSVNKKQIAVTFSEELRTNAKLYVAIANANDEIWDPYGATSREYMRTLNLLGMIQMRPLLLAILDKLPASEIQNSLKILVSWAVRLLMSGTSGSGTLENHYSQRAMEVRKGSIKTAKELALAMQGVVPSDTEFITLFENASVSKSNIARYYLRVLEKQAQNEPEPAFIPNSNQDQVNLEHILPQNPSNAWGHIDAETAKAYYNRIGNLTLLQKSKNSNLGNKGFPEKLLIYKVSPFKITSSLTSSLSWGTSQIEQRQQWLAGLAVKAWPIKV